MAYWCPLMASSEKDVWVFRIVHQDTGKPAQGVPVTVLDPGGSPAGYWVSEADGTVAIPRRNVAKVRLRVGLRNEEPIELITATLGAGPIDLAAPTWLPRTPSGGSERAAPPAAPPAPNPSPAATPRSAEPHEVPGHVLYFQRLVMFAERAPEGRGATPSPVADFFALPSDHSTLRYGVLVELEESWQSLGVQWGELLYSVSLTPGDEARLAVLDGRWRREAEARERPLQILARMVGSSMLGDLVTALGTDLQLDPLRLPNLATPDVVRRFGYIFRRTLLDRALQPDLDRLLASDDGWSGEGKGGTGRPGGAHNRLLDHIEANLLYYSTAIISAGDPASRHAALAKLRDPSGRPLTDLVENTVLGRIGNAIALPLRSAAQLPREWQDALAAYTAPPPRVSAGFTATLPHPGGGVTAQPPGPTQQAE